MGLALRDKDGEEALWFDILRAPLEVVLGSIVGLLGAALATLSLPPVPEDCAATTSHYTHVLTLLALAVLCAFGLKRGGFSGASALAVLVLSVLAACRWGKKTAKLVAGTMGQAWNTVAQPLLFGLVGAAVSLGDLDARLVGLGVGMLACSLTCRCVVTFLAVGGKGLRKEERLFAALAWMPKATVQAAVGAVALDEATTDADEDRGRDVLALAVLSILCTAPVGAVVISLTGPRLLLLDRPNGAEPNTEPGQGAAAEAEGANAAGEPIAHEPASSAPTTSAKAPA